MPSPRFLGLGSSCVGSSSLAPLPSPRFLGLGSSCVGPPRSPPCLPRGSLALVPRVLVRLARPPAFPSVPRPRFLVCWSSLLAPLPSPRFLGLSSSCVGPLGLGSSCVGPGRWPPWVPRGSSASVPRVLVLLAGSPPAPRVGSSRERFLAPPRWFLVKVGPPRPPWVPWGSGWGGKGWERLGKG